MDAAMPDEVAALRAENASLRAEIAALRAADKEAAVLAGLGTLSLAGGDGGGLGVPVPHDDEEEEEEKDAESDDEGTLARLAAVSPHLVDDGNPMYAGRKTDVYEVRINEDRSIKYTDGKFTIKKVGMFNYAYKAMYWVVKEKSGDGTLPPGWDESKGCDGMPAIGGIFGKDKRSFQAHGYDANVAKYGVLFPQKQVNEYNKTKYKTSAAVHVVYTTPEQYLLVKHVHDIESKTDFVNVLPAAIRK